MERQDSVQRFLELIRRSHRGKFKVYIGMSAGVGKTYAMLKAAQAARRRGVDVVAGYVEPHARELVKKAATNMMRKVAGKPWS